MEYDWNERTKLMNETAMNELLWDAIERSEADFNNEGSRGYVHINLDTTTLEVENYYIVQSEELGGGVDLDLIHEIDYAYWLFGMPENITKFCSSKSSLGIQANDFAQYYLTYPNFNLSITLNYYRRDPKRTLEVVCEDGTFLVDLLKNKIDFRGEQVVSFQTTISDTYTTQLSFFIDKIVNGKEIFNDAEEAYNILKICQHND
jgi:predicted dehydrogenase